MPPRKRTPTSAVAVGAPLTSKPSGRRRSQRVSSAAQMTKYVETDDDEENDTRQTKRRRTLNARGRQRQDEKEDGDTYEETSDHEANSTADDKDATGEDDEVDEDAPPKVTFIPHKQLRDLGGVEYADDRVHPVTLLFLRDLKANNQRNWLKENDKEFRRAQADWLTYVTAMTERITADVDATVPELPAKDIVFRIYRDIRFSKDPSPYKPHFSAAWSRTGKKGPYACYYVHCEPGNRCFVGGGLWHPVGDALRLLRASIDERRQRWQRLFANEDVRQTFFGDVPAGDAAAVERAFAAANAEGALKKGPVGYRADHCSLALLKLRNFTLHKAVPDTIFTADNGQDQVVAILRALEPFVTHLNRIVMPDPGDDDDGDDDGEEDGDNDGEE